MPLLAPVLPRGPIDLGRRLRTLPGDDIELSLMHQLLLRLRSFLMCWL
jgi:hypothetical protein